MDCLVLREKRGGGCSKPCRLAARRLDGWIMFRIWWAVIRSVESLGAPGALVRSRILVRPEMSCEVICSLVDALADVADVVG